MRFSAAGLLNAVLLSSKGQPLVLAATRLQERYMTTTSVHLSMPFSLKTTWLSSTERGDITAQPARSHSLRIIRFLSPANVFLRQRFGDIETLRTEGVGVGIVDMTLYHRVVVEIHGKHIDIVGEIDDNAQTDDVVDLLFATSVAFTL